MTYEYKTLFEIDSESLINELAAEGWEPIQSNAYTFSDDDSACVYVLLRREKR